MLKKFKQHIHQNFPFLENEKLLIQNFSKKAQLVVKREGNICFSYDRVSSRDQMINGNSLKWQFERIDDWFDLGFC